MVQAGDRQGQARGPRTRRCAPPDQQQEIVCMRARQRDERRQAAQQRRQAAGSGRHCRAPLEPAHTLMEKRSSLECRARPPGGRCQPDCWVEGSQHARRGRAGWRRGRLCSCRDAVVGLPLAHLSSLLDIHHTMRWWQAAQAPPRPGRCHRCPGMVRQQALKLGVDASWSGQPHIQARKIDWQVLCKTKQEHNAGPLFPLPPAPLLPLRARGWRRCTAPSPPLTCVRIS